MFQDEAVDLEALIIQLSERGEVEEDGPTIEEQLAVAKEELILGLKWRSYVNRAKIDENRAFRHLFGSFLTVFDCVSMDSQLFGEGEAYMRDL